MAVYNRDFLVQYLKDICALELATDKLNDRLQELHMSIYALDCKQDYSMPYAPEKPSHEKVFTIGRIVIGLLGFLITTLFVVALIIICFFYPNDSPAPDWSTIVIIICTLAYGSIWYFGSIDPIKSAIKYNKNENIRYQNNLQKYEAECKRVRQINHDANISRQKKRRALSTEHKVCAAEADRARKARNRAYNVNVIPMQYRNTYAAFYLYQWFSTSRADDLDMALNTFVLEEIKSKLDSIIRNQGRIILNQYLMIENQEQMMTNQQQAIDAQLKQSQMMQSKLDHLAVSNEERNTYLGMIEGNTATTAYFAAADYLRKL